MERDNRLGDFLRARRDRLDPEVVGVRAGGPRRVPGLRRDELAELAGVSEAYYIRLERGRDRHPSPQVLDALARALRLDDGARRHLHELAGAVPVGAAPPPSPSLAAVPDGVAAIVAGWPGPASASDLTGTILAANPLSRALSPVHRPGTNAYRSLFLDPEMRALYAQDWERVSGAVVAGLRATVGAEPDDERLWSLIGELVIASEEFRTLWARYEVGPRPGSGITRLVHPLVGPIALRFEKLAATDHPGVGLVLFSAGPDAADVDALERLRASVVGAQHGGELAA